MRQIWPGHVAGPASKQRRAKLCRWPPGHHAEMGCGCGNGAVLPDGPGIVAAAVAVADDALATHQQTWGSGLSGCGSAALTCLVFSSAMTSSQSLARACMVCSATLTALIFGASVPALKSVSAKPACTATTRVPCSRRPCRREFVNDHSAALAAAYPG